MAEAKTTKGRVLRRLFAHDDGSVTGRAGLDVNTVIFKLEDEREIRDELAKYFGGKLPPPCVGRAAAAFGINTSAGNVVGTLERERDEDGKITGTPHPDDVFEALNDRLETFKAGRWAEESAAGGPRTSLMLETAIKFRKEVQGKDSDPDWLAKTRERFEDDKDFTKKLLSDPQFRAIHEGIKLERAQARATAAAQKAAGSKGASTLDL